MKITDRQLSQNGLFDALFPRFDGRVFHGTDESIHDILGCGEIRPNQQGQYCSPYGTNSFFGKRGCVLLFDYRFTVSEQFEKFYSRCLPTLPARPGAVLAYLFIANPLHADLLPWTLWKKRRRGVKG